MTTVRVYLDSVKKVQQFVGTIAPLSGDFELVSGNFVLDARSLMGIFGFDLTKPVILKVYHDGADNMAAIAPFLVNTEDEK